MAFERDSGWYVSAVLCGLHSGKASKRRCLASEAVLEVEGALKDGVVEGEERGGGGRQTDFLGRSVRGTC